VIMLTAPNSEQQSQHQHASSSDEASS